VNIKEVEKRAIEPTGRDLTSYRIYFANERSMLDWFRSHYYTTYLTYVLSLFWKRSLMVLHF